MRKTKRIAMEFAGFEIGPRFEDSGKLARRDLRLPTIR
jgi:hypothetical protein